MTFLNGVRKRRLIAKETSIANCEVLDEKHRTAVQGIFVGIIIKAGGANYLFLAKNWQLKLCVCVCVGGGDGGEGSALLWL